MAKLALAGLAILLSSCPQQTQKQQTQKQQPSAPKPQMLNAIPSGPTESTPGINGGSYTIPVVTSISGVINYNACLYRRGADLGPGFSDEQRAATLEYERMAWNELYRSTVMGAPKVTAQVTWRDRTSSPMNCYIIEKVAWQQ